MKYIINPDFEIIRNDKMTTLLANNLEKVYILQEIETLIWEQFQDGNEIESTYKCFLSKYPKISIIENDYEFFLNQLIQHNILVEFYDQNPVSS